VMISQNRADEKRQALADHEWQTVQDEAQQNETLLRLSDEILQLARAIHATTVVGVPFGVPAEGAAVAADQSPRPGETDDAHCSVGLPDRRQLS